MHWVVVDIILIQKSVTRYIISLSTNRNSSSLAKYRCLWTTEQTARCHNILISSLLIQEKRKKVAEILELENFKASNGWLDSFRRRHNISFRTLSGESAHIDKRIVENWKLYLPKITKGYDPCNIWNLDETGLFWRGLPKKI